MDSMQDQKKYTVTFNGNTINITSRQALVKRKIMKYLRLLLMIICLIVSSKSHAQFISNNTLVMIVPFGVGGSADIVARNVEYAIEKNTNIRIAVINQGGASGNIGMRSFLQKQKILLLTSENILMNKKYLTDSYPHGIIEKVNPIYFFAQAPFILYGYKRFDTIEDLIHESKNREILFGTATPGSGSYESYNQLCNVKKILKQCRRVAYASSGAAVMDLLSGRLDVYASLYSSHQTYVSMNTVKPLVILSENNFQFLEDVPTSSKLLDGISIHNWYGIFHVGLSDAEVNIVRNGLNLFFDKSKLEQLGYDLVDPDPKTFWQKEKQIKLKEIQ